MYETKTENVYENFSTNKEKFDFSNYSTTSKYYNNSNKLIIEKMKDETGSAAIEEFVGLKPKDVLLNNKGVRHSMNGFLSKDHRIGTYEISKILLSCIDDKIYI